MSAVGAKPSYGRVAMARNSKWLLHKEQQMAAALGAEVADIDLSKPLPRGRHPGWQEEGWKIPATVEGCTHIAPLRCRWRGRARGTAEARQLAMSALGQKRTFRKVWSMSAYPQKRTFVGAVVMSWRTSGGRLAAMGFRQSRRCPIDRRPPAVHQKSSAGDVACCVRSQERHCCCHFVRPCPSIEYSV